MKTPIKPSLQFETQALPQTQSARRGVRFVVIAGESLEDKLASDLHGARNVITSDRSEGSVVPARVDRGGTTVIEGVERFQAKLQAGPFSEFYVLEQ